jgi:hypothetical protein
MLRLRKLFILFIALFVVNKSYSCEESARFSK